MYENLCLQLEVDNLHMKYEKLKLDKTKSETNNRLKYIKHEKTKSAKKEHKKVRIKEEQPEKLEKDFANIPSTSQTRHVQQRPSDEEVLKIFERNRLPGIPHIKILSGFETPSSSHASQNGPSQIPQVLEKPKDVEATKKDALMKNVLEKPNSKLALFQVSNVSSRTSTVTNGSLVRVRSSPEIVRTSSFTKNY